MADKDQILADMADIVNEHQDRWRRRQLHHRAPGLIPGRPGLVSPGL